MHEALKSLYHLMPEIRIGCSFFETCKWRLEDPPSGEKKAIEAGTWLGPGWHCAEEEGTQPLPSNCLGSNPGSANQLYGGHQVSQPLWLYFIIYKVKLRAVLTSWVLMRETIGLKTWEFPGWNLKLAPYVKGKERPRKRRISPDW